MRRALITGINGQDGAYSSRLLIARGYEVTALDVAHLLQALPVVKPDVRFYQASSSEMFGLARETAQTETTPFYPRSLYGAAKVYAHWMTVHYCEA